uniref:Uncharacterized protein n=1 Tax=Anguilla anguilla TaxID=7936 RepID=A0A0E9VR04_ANGAN
MSISEIKDWCSVSSLQGSYTDRTNMTLTGFISLWKGC